MNTTYKFALAALAGIAVGSAVVEGLHAQTKPPAYVVVAIRSVKDADAFKPASLIKPRQPRSPPWAAVTSYALRQ